VPLVISMRFAETSNCLLSCPPPPPPPSPLHPALWPMRTRGLSLQGRVQCSVREIADQFRLSEQHTNNEVMRLRRVLLAEAQDVPWLRHLTGKTVAPHWRVITRLYNASHRCLLAPSSHLCLTSTWAYYNKDTCPPPLFPHGLCCLILENPGTSLASLAQPVCKISHCILSTGSRLVKKLKLSKAWPVGDQILQSYRGITLCYYRMHSIATARGGVKLCSRMFGVNGLPNCALTLSSYLGDESHHLHSTYNTENQKRFFQSST